jgi:tetratricopeptide (TPR) repeat protein
MAMVDTRRIAALFALAVLPSAVGTGQGLPGESRKRLEVTEEFAATKIAAWTAAVQAHEAGAIDEPVRAIASWPREHVTAVLGGVIERMQRLVTARDVPAARERAELTETMVRGLSLHTDIALAERELLMERPAAGPPAIFLVDGRETRQLARSFHWAFARQIATALAPARAARVLAWYRAIGAGLQERGDLDVVDVHLETGRQLFADDPMLALYQGTLHQTYGDARLQDYVRRQRGMLAGRPRPPVPPRLVGRPPASDLRRVPNRSQAELDAAEREFRLALSIDPALHEARIRLAHVLTTLGDDRGAADTIRPALAAPLTPFLEFYAAMVLGRSEEHLGHHAEAGDAYARAAARFPGAQSAKIGRSRVRLAQGRATEALASLVDDAAFGDPGEHDPWLSYLRAHEPDGATLLKAWRESLP